MEVLGENRLRGLVEWGGVGGFLGWGMLGKCWMCIVTYRAGSLAIQGLQENHPALFLILQPND